MELHLLETKEIGTILAFGGRYGIFRPVSCVRRAACPTRRAVPVRRAHVNLHWLIVPNAPHLPSASRHLLYAPRRL